MNSNKVLPTIPQNAKNIIIILGQCSLPNGNPHPWLVQRINFAYQLISKQKLDINQTYVIVSGSDVSNREFKNQDKHNWHLTQAQLMFRQFCRIHEKKLLNKQINNKQQNILQISLQQFKKHIIIEDQANTTIQNFYYSLYIIHNSKISQKLKKIYVLTSDFHIKRAKFVFDAFFFNEKLQIIGNPQAFKYNEQVIFIPCQSVWTEGDVREKKFKKQQQLLVRQSLIDQAKHKSKRFWQELKLNQKH